MTEFFEMGGYGFYVWSAYGLTLLVFSSLTYWIWLRRRALDKRRAILQQRDSNQRLRQSE